MDAALPNTQYSTETLGMDFGWEMDSYPAAYAGTANGLDLANPDYAMAYGVKTEEASPDNAMSSFTYQQPPFQKQNLAAATTVDPANMWSDPSSTPSTASGRDYTNSDSPATKIEKSEPRDSPLEAPEAPPETTAATRARHAANHRHSKSQSSRRDSQGSNAEPDTVATDKKQRLREKNKVAAAKCRQRQRKQAQNIQAKGGRLSETNAQLKSYVQDLRGELNGLRAYALGHENCDCQIAHYNQGQAQRVIAEYHSHCSGYGGQAVVDDQANF